MKYELAKKLKDAGFLQDKKSMSIDRYVDACEPPRNVVASEYEKLRDRCFIPTLEELIEACGKITLQGEGCTDKNGIKCWRAAMPNKDNTGYSEMSDGETPLEAVANLWLELKKK